MTYEEYVELRDKKGVKDADVARGTGFNRTTFADWKSGKGIPKYEKMSKIEEFLEYKKEPTDYVIESDLGFIDVETQKLVRNSQLHRLLMAGGKIMGEHPEVIEAMIYTLEKMGEKNEV